MVLKIFKAAAMMMSFVYVSAQTKSSALDNLFDRSSFADKSGYHVLIMQKNAVVYEKQVQDFALDKQVPIASASKWLAGAVIMRLTEKGFFSLDDRISKYIPSFNTTEKKNITIRQCFSHTSGLPGGQEAFDEFMGKRLKRYEKVVDDIAETNLIAAPGSQFNYGGMSMQVAGRVAEIATGKNWHQLFKEELTEPLEMSNTHYPGYRLNMVPRIAGGVLSTANDYMHFLQMILENGSYKGKRFLRSETVRVLLADQINNAAIGYSPYTKYGNQKNNPGYGIGNWILNFDGTVVNSSPGAFGFTPWVDLKKGYIGVIAVRSSFQKVMPVFAEAIRIIDSGM